MATMSSVNDLVLQLQLLRDAAPSGTVPVQAAIYLSIAFGRPSAEAVTDKELTNCLTYCKKHVTSPTLSGEANASVSLLAVDHSSFIRTLRRLLPLDEHGTREIVFDPSTRSGQSC